MSAKLNHIQLEHIRQCKREVRDILLCSRHLTRRRMPKGADQFSFRKEGTLFEREYFTFDQLVARRLARKAMG